MTSCSVFCSQDPQKKYLASLFVSVFLDISSSYRRPCSCHNDSLYDAQNLLKKCIFIIFAVQMTKSRCQGFSSLSKTTALGYCNIWTRAQVFMSDSHVLYTRRCDLILNLFKEWTVSHRKSHFKKYPIDLLINIWSINININIWSINI